MPNRDKYSNARCSNTGDDTIVSFSIGQEKSDIDKFVLDCANSITKSDIDNFLLFVQNSDSPCANFFKAGRLSRKELQNTQPMFKDARSFVKDDKARKAYKILLNEYTRLSPAFKSMKIKIESKEVNSGIILGIESELCYVGCKKVYSSQSNIKNKTQLDGILKKIFIELLVVLIKDHKMANLNEKSPDVSDANEGFNSVLVNLSSNDAQNVTDVNDTLSEVTNKTSASSKFTISEVTNKTSASSKFTITEILFNIIEAPLDQLLSKFVKSDDIRDRVKDMLSSSIKAVIGLSIFYISEYISENAMPGSKVEGTKLTQPFNNSENSIAV